MATVTTEISNTTLIARLQGRLDSDNALDIKAEIYEEIEDQTRLVIDLAELNYISSAGLRILAILSTDAKKGAYGFSLARPKAEVDYVLKMSGFHKMIVIHPTIEEALA